MTYLYIVEADAITIAVVTHESDLIVRCIVRVRKSESFLGPRRDIIGKVSESGPSGSIAGAVVDGKLVLIASPNGLCMPEVQFGAEIEGAEIKSRHS